MPIWQCIYFTGFSSCIVPNWSAIPSYNFQNPSQVGGSSYTLRADQYASGIGSVSVTFGCGATVSKEVGVNTPAYDEVTFWPEEGYEMCPGEYYTIYADVHDYYTISHYNWEIFGGRIAFGQGTDHIEIETDYGSGFQGLDVYVTLTSSCGSEMVEPAETRYERDYYCGFMYSLIPNPSDDYVQITTKSSNERTNKRNEVFETGTIRIFDSFGRVHSAIRLESNNQRISTSNLKNGTYILEISTKSDVERHNLVVAH